MQSKHHAPPRTSPHQLGRLEQDTTALEEGRERAQQAVTHLQEMKAKTRTIYRGLQASVQQQTQAAGESSGEEMDVEAA